MTITYSILEARERIDSYVHLDRKSKPCGDGWIPFNKSVGIKALQKEGSRLRQPR